MRGLCWKSPIKKGWTALHHAAHALHLNTVQKLLAVGANANAVTAEGETPLMLAVLQLCQRESVRNVLEASHQSLLQRLIEHGTNVNEQDCWGRTVLHLAVAMNWTDLCRFLLNHKALSTVKTFAFTPPGMSSSAEQSSPSVTRTFFPNSSPFTWASRLYQQAGTQRLFPPHLASSTRSSPSGTTSTSSTAPRATLLRTRSKSHVYMTQYEAQQEMEKAKKAYDESLSSPLRAAASKRETELHEEAAEQESLNFDILNSEKTLESLAQEFMTLRKTQQSTHRVQRTMQKTINDLKQRVSSLYQTCAVKEKQTIQAEQTRILQHPKLRLYYNTVRSFFGLYCTSASLLNAGLIARRSYTKGDALQETLSGVITAGKYASMLVLPPITGVIECLEQGVEEAIGVVEAAHAAHTWHAEQARGQSYYKRLTQRTNPTRIKSPDTLLEELDILCTSEETKLRRMALLTNSPKELERTAEQLARTLTLRYQSLLYGLASESLTEFAMASVHRLVLYLKEGRLQSPMADTPYTRDRLVAELTIMISDPSLDQSPLFANLTKGHLLTRIDGQTTTEQALHAYTGLRVIKEGGEEIVYRHSTMPQLTSYMDPEQHGYRVTPYSSFTGMEIQALGLVEQRLVGENDSRPNPIPDIVRNTGHSSTATLVSPTTSDEAAENEEMPESVSQKEETKDTINRLKEENKINKENLHTLSSAVELLVKAQADARVLPTESQGARHSNNLRNCRELSKVLGEVTAIKQYYEPSPAVTSKPKPKKTPQKKNSKVHSSTSENQTRSQQLF